MFGHWDAFGFAGLLGLLLNLWVVALVVLGVVLVVRALSRSGQAAPSPQQILAERFARGEIDADEYQARLRVLNGEPPAPTQP